MRRKLAVLLIMCFLLTGCGNTDRALSSAMDFRADLVQAGGCSFTARVTADFGESIQNFTMECRSDPKGDITFLLKEPETLEGITGTVTSEGGKITYDGLALDFGLLADGKVIPAAAPAILTSCWAGEYISAAGTEEDLTRVTYEKGFENKLVADTWFQNHVPICGEVCYNGTEILRIEITDFLLN